MKSIIKHSFLLLALLGVMFTSCKKDYPEPPIQVLPIGTVYTIDSILNMESGTVFNEDASVYGIITADEKSGNLYKAAFMQDRATGKAIELYLNATSGVRIGDSVRVYLKDVTYAMYNGLPQLSGFEADGHIVILANNLPISPVETTIANVIAGNHRGQVIKLNNVMFTDRGTFAEPTTYGNRTLVDPSNLSQSVIVRTSNYANFANDSLPRGVGNLVAIASVYNTTWQLLLRSASELEFEGYTPGPNVDDNVMTLPYYQSFASDFGTYSTYNVSGDQEWVIDYSTAKMTGFENSVNYPNEDWLISAPVSLEGVSSVTLTMEYIARYFNNVNNDITIQVSTDYESGNPNDATWTHVDASLTLGSDWNTFYQATVDLSAFAGQQVVVAVRYVSDAVKAGTIEVKSLVIQEGGSPTPPPPGPNPGGEVQNMPYIQSFETEFGTYVTKNVLGDQVWEIDFQSAKMSGYAGSAFDNEDWLISSPVQITGVEHAKVVVNYAAKYSGPSDRDITVQVSSNYEYDTDPTTATWVELSTVFANNNKAWSFDDVETSLDEFIGQTVTVAVKYTSTTNGARTIEIKTITVEEGEATGGDTPPTPPTPGEGEGSGTAEDPYNVAAGIGLQSDKPTAWVRGYIVGAVINGTSSVASNSDVLWSGPFDSATNVVIADDPDCHEVSQCIFVNLPAGKPLRTEVNLKDHPENLGKTLAVYGKLRAYFGQAGLRDSGGTANDFILEGGDTPPTPPTPDDVIFSETFASGQGQFVIEDVLMPEELTYVWAHASNYSCMKASAFVGHAYETESWLVSPDIDLLNYQTATLTFDQAVNYASPDGALSVMISTEYENTVDGITWIELPVSEWPSGNGWDFVNSTVDLTPYAGQIVHIAFKYTSTENAAATWEVKNFVVK